MHKYSFKRVLVLIAVLMLTTIIGADVATAKMMENIKTMPETLIL